MNALFNDKVNSNEDERMTIVIKKTVAIIKNLNVKYFGETQQSEQQLVETTQTKIEPKPRWKNQLYIPTLYANIIHV